MTTSENNTNAIRVEWKDPKKELPEANSYVLAAFSWSGSKEIMKCFSLTAKIGMSNMV